MDIVAAVIFSLFFLVGLVGVVVPVVPSTPLVAVGAVIYGLMTGFARLSVTGVLVVVGLALLAQLLDYFAGVYGGKRFGASRAGSWGGVLGSLLGLILLPPFGFLPGALLGAVLAELLARRSTGDAMWAGWGTLLGTLGGVVIKFILTVAMGVIVFRAF